MSLCHPDDYADDDSHDEDGSANLIRKHQREVKLFGVSCCDGYASEDLRTGAQD